MTDMEHVKAASHKDRLGKPGMAGRVQRRSPAPSNSHRSSAAVLAPLWEPFFLGALQASTAMRFVGTWILMPLTLVIGLLALSERSTHQPEPGRQ